MQHLSHSSRRHQSISGKFCGCQDQVRFFALHRIKPHAPPLVRAPSIHLSFNLAAVLPGGRFNALAPEATPQGHNLQIDIVYGGLPGYLILFAPHAFAPERQSLSRGAAFATGIPPDLYAFHRYTEFYPPLQDSSLPVSNAVPEVEPGDFTSDLTDRLRALYAQ